MLAEFGGVSVSCFEVVLCESDVRRHKVSVVLLSLRVTVAW